MNHGLFIVTLNEAKGLKSLCENRAGHSQRFQIPHCVRNDMATALGMTWLRNAIMKRPCP